MSYRPKHVALLSVVEYNKLLLLTVNTNSVDNCVRKSEVDFFNSTDRRKELKRLSKTDLYGGSFEYWAA